MPLVTIMGPPSSGKSSFAQYLQDFILEKGDSNLYSISRGDEDAISPPIISNHILTSNLNTLYDTSNHEKQARGQLKSRLMNQITKKRIIINDGLNEIKGWRFELFRYCQEVGTRHVVVQMRKSLDQCLHNNQNHKRIIPKGVPLEDENSASSGEQVKWDDTLLKEIYGRMEWADGKNRWDKPLFVVQYWDSEDARDQIFKETAQDVWDALHDTSKTLKSKRPNNIAKDLSDTNTLYEIERITNKVVKKIMEMKTTSMPGDSVQVCQETKEKFVYPRRPVSLMQLRRLRQQFIKMQQTAEIRNINSIYGLFIIYLNNTYK